MKYKIFNDQLGAVISLQGAELTSLKDFRRNEEIIWGGDPQFWARHAPILFPIVGRLANDQFRFGDRAYKLPQHGFARDLIWQLEAQATDSLTLLLIDSEQTRQVYPFAFELRAHYQLVDNKLVQRYMVTNPSTSDVLYFNLGFHPAFRLPLQPFEAFENCYLTFDQPETQSVPALAGGLRDYSQTRVVLQSQTEVTLTPDLFAQDAWVLEGLQSKSISLRHKSNGYHINVGTYGFPWLGLWSKPNAPFVCIEPWHGVADPIEPYNQLPDKPGIQSLAPGEDFSTAYAIEVLSA